MWQVQLAATRSRAAAQQGPCYRRRHGTCSRTSVAPYAEANRQELPSRVLTALLARTPLATPGAVAITNRRETGLSCAPAVSAAASRVRRVKPLIFLNGAIALSGLEGRAEIRAIRLTTRPERRPPPEPLPHPEVQHLDTVRRDVEMRMEVGDPIGLVEEVGEFTGRLLHLDRPPWVEPPLVHLEAQGQSRNPGLGDQPERLTFRERLVVAREKIRPLRLIVFPWLGRDVAERIWSILGVGRVIWAAGRRR